MYSVSVLNRSGAFRTSEALVALLLGLWCVNPATAGESCCTKEVAQVSGYAADVQDEHFLATLRCAVTCSGGESEIVSTVRSFHPLEHGLRPGDGSDQRSAPWGGFTGTFEAWSRMTCLEEAANQCGGITKVETSGLTSVTSGSWKLDGRVVCPDAGQVALIEAANYDPQTVFPGHVPVLSPFDDESGSDRRGEAPGDSAPALPQPLPGAVLEGPEDNPTLRRVDTFDFWMDRAITFREVPDSLTQDADVRRFLLESTKAHSEDEYLKLMYRKHSISPAAPCTTVIRGRACFGDCLEFPEGRGFEQYLATNKLGAENIGTFAVCGDRLSDFFAVHPLSKDAQDVYCEQFVMNSLVRGRSTAITCSSYRIRADCSAVVH